MNVLHVLTVQSMRWQREALLVGEEEVHGRVRKL
jgi:hypothetical protein